jgi:hypothetical protein
VIVIGVVSLLLGDWVVMADGAIPTADEANLIATINTITRITIAATVVLTAITFALGARRFVRMRPEG